jgi:hypothetical protein
MQREGLPLPVSDGLSSAVHALAADRSQTYMAYGRGTFGDALSLVRKASDSRTKTAAQLVLWRRRPLGESRFAHMSQRHQV